MKKIKMFEQMYSFDKELKNSIDTYGRDHRYTEWASFEWNGAYNLLEAAGLLEEYRAYKLYRVKKELGI